MITAAMIHARMRSQIGLANGPIIPLSAVKRPGHLRHLRDQRLHRVRGDRDLSGGGARPRDQRATRDLWRDPDPEHLLCPVVLVPGAQHRAGRREGGSGRRSRPAGEQRRPALSGHDRPRRAEPADDHQPICSDAGLLQQHHPLPVRAGPRRIAARAAGQSPCDARLALGCVHPADRDAGADRWRVRASGARSAAQPCHQPVVDSGGTRRPAAQWARAPPPGSVPLHRLRGVPVGPPGRPGRGGHPPPPGASARELPRRAQRLRRFFPPLPAPIGGGRSSLCPRATGNWRSRRSGAGRSDGLAPRGAVADR